MERDIAANEGIGRGFRRGAATKRKSSSGRQRGTLVLPNEVVRQIDRKRGYLGRERFLDLCVDSHLKAPPGRVSAKPGVYVAKRDLRDFRRGIKDVLRSCSELFMAYAVAFGAPTRTWTRTASPPRVQSQPAHIERPAHWWSIISLSDIPLTLWIAAILLFGFGDSLTSVLAFSVGAYEANPLMVGLVQVFGGSLWAFVAVKTMVLLALFFLSYYALPGHGWLVPTLLSVIGTYLVLSNLIAFFTRI